MIEVPANIPVSDTHAQIIGTTRDGNSDSTKEKASSKITDNDTSARMGDEAVRTLRVQANQNPK